MRRTELALPRRRRLCALGACLFALAVGCHSLKLNLLLLDGIDGKGDQDRPVARVPGAPGKYSVRIAPYVFLSDFEINRDLPVFQELVNLRDQVYKELQLAPGTAAVQVYLFEDRDRYEQFMKAKYPDLPRRRAFFVAQPRTMGGTEDLLVYTSWGDKIQQDLRHELTHALLHSVLKDVPLWLDEGLAEYFELPPENRGVNFTHVANLRRGLAGLYKPDLPRLEGLSQVQQMSPVEYREAWAWVHLLLRGRPEGKAELIAYLQQLRSNPNPGPLAPRVVRVYPSLDEAFEKHIGQLETHERAQAPAAPKAVCSGPYQ
jgi:hypothetical protein